ncbi:MAG: hypothetical protein M1837_004391 [Sclerophora amabilis]|nr:MAG: hypothetical protein M1837_004391 [Sclerophora amabilis]
MESEIPEPHLFDQSQWDVSGQLFKLQDGRNPSSNPREWERAPKPAAAPRFKGRKIWKRYPLRSRMKSDMRTGDTAPGVESRSTGPVWVCPSPWRQPQEQGGVMKRRYLSIMHEGMHLPRENEFDEDSSTMSAISTDHGKGPLTSTNTKSSGSVMSGGPMILQKDNILLFDSHSAEDVRSRHVVKSVISNFRSDFGIGKVGGSGATPEYPKSCSRQSSLDSTIPSGPEVPDPTPVSEPVINAVTHALSEALPISPLPQSPRDLSEPNRESFRDTQDSPLLMDQICQSEDPSSPSRSSPKSLTTEETAIASDTNSNICQAIANSSTCLDDATESPSFTQKLDRLDNSQSSKESSATLIDGEHVVTADTNPDVEQPEKTSAGLSTSPDDAIEFPFSLIRGSQPDAESPSSYNSLAPATEKESLTDIGSVDNAKQAIDDTGTCLNDDTDMLKDFLDRVKAGKAAKVAKQEALTQSHPQSPHRGFRSPLGEMNTNAASPQRATNQIAGSPLGDIEHGKESKGQITGRTEEAMVFRRSKRTRPDASSKDTPSGPNSITVRRPKGAGPIILKNPIASEVANLTRTNTKRNRGQPCASVIGALETSNPGVTSPIRCTRSTSKKTVLWDEQLVYFQQQVDKKRKTAPLARSRGQGNGTPAPKRRTRVNTFSG